MSTIYDVAKLANVSAMTVSRALNTPEKVKPSSRKRIEDAIATLGYRQNQAARALVTKTTGIVKIVIPDSIDSSDPYFSTLFSGIIDVLSKKLIALLVVKNTTSHVKSDGMIVMGLKADQKLIVDEYPSPVVLFGKGSDKADWVDVDNEGGSYLATRHLLDLGHKKIAFFKFYSDEPFIKEREEGYRRAMAEAGIDIDKDWIVRGMESTSNAAKMQAMRILRTSNVTGIVCTSDVVGMGVAQGAKELGINVPKDLSIIGFDAVGYDMMSDPRLTSMRQPVYEIGQRLASILVERITNQKSDYTPYHEIVTTSLVVRDSTAKLS